MLNNPKEHGEEFRMTVSVFPCLRGVIGDWVYYSTLMSAAEIAEKILQAHVIRESKSLEDYLQRDLSSNVKKIKNYINQREDRFFNSIIIGVFDGIPEWLTFSLRDIESLEELDDIKVDLLEDSIGLLKLNGEEKMFAIDGQHRIEAIKQRYLDDDQFDDQFSIIFVSHKDDSSGKKRTRRLFADINKKAIKVSNGDLAIIDEEDFHNIVGRRIYSEYEPFKGGKYILLTKNAAMPNDNEEHFTNLLTLCTINKILKPLSGHRNIAYFEKEKLNEMYEIAQDFFNFLFAYSSDLSNCIISNEKSIKETRVDNRNFLLRPIGIDIMARIYKKAIQLDRLEELKVNLDKFDFDMQGIYLDKFIWNNGAIESKNKMITHDIMLYVFDLFDGDIEELNSRVAIATKGTKGLPEKI